MLIWTNARKELLVEVATHLFVLIHEVDSSVNVLKVIRDIQTVKKDASVSFSYIKSLFLIDLNECDTPEIYCGNKSKCKNTPGFYLCECFEGYEQAKNSSQCVDVNECLMSPCDKNAICTNLGIFYLKSTLYNEYLDGTFSCECVEGFVGSGLECKGMLLD